MCSNYGSQLLCTVAKVVEKNLVFAKIESLL